MWWIGFGFGSLGLAIGHIAGLTETATAATIVAALFTLIGGSTLAFFKAAKQEIVTFQLCAVASISLGLLIGIHSGVYIRLTALPAYRDPGTELNPYMRRGRQVELSALQGQLVHLRRQIEDKSISKEGAFDALAEFIESAR